LVKSTNKRPANNRVQALAHTTQPNSLALKLLPSR